MADNLILDNGNPVQDERDIAIQITGLKKRYKLGLITAGTLKGDIQSWWARKRGKEDPNLKIGAKVHGKNEVFMALDGIDLTIYKGERIGIIGHNGAGKSTLLKLLARVTGPTEGEIKIDGRITSMLEVGTGFNGELTGRENIYLNGAILGMTKAEVDKKMEQIIEFSECRQFIDTPVKRYSSGMFVKLAFSVAAHLDSEIMIMDEVLAVGDMAFQKKCLEKMSDVSKAEGRTILYVSHNMNTIRQLCDRCIVMDHGKIIFNGDVEEAISIYLQTRYESKTIYDYKDIKRSPNEKRSLQMLGLEILNRKFNQVIIGEDVNLVIHCISNYDITEVGLRFEIYYVDNSVVGTMFLDQEIKAHKGEKIDLFCSFNTKNFTPGNYKFIALTYEYDKMGNQIGLDRVDPAMFIDLLPKKKDLRWSHRYWGHVHFDDIAINKIDRK